MRIRILFCLALATAVLATGCDDTNTGNSSDDRNFFERAWAKVENGFSDQSAPPPTGQTTGQMADSATGADTPAGEITPAGDTSEEGQGRGERQRGWQ